MRHDHRQPSHGPIGSTQCPIQGAAGECPTLIFRHGRHVSTARQLGTTDYDPVINATDASDKRCLRQESFREVPSATCDGRPPNFGCQRICDKNKGTRDKGQLVIEIDAAKLSASGSKYSHQKNLVKGCDLSKEVTWGLSLGECCRIDEHVVGRGTLMTVSTSESNRFPSKSCRSGSISKNMGM
jgi:hypothetical protein